MKIFTFLTKLFVERQRFVYIRAEKWKSPTKETERHSWQVITICKTQNSLLTSSFKIEFKHQVLFIMTLWVFFKIKNNKLKTTLNTIWLINCISFLSRKKEEEVVLVHDSETVKSITYHCKLLQFHMNYRPPYYGTWRKRSQKLSPRNPFKMDTVSLGL